MNKPIQEFGPLVDFVNELIQLRVYFPGGSAMFYGRVRLVNGTHDLEPFISLEGAYVRLPVDVVVYKERNGQVWSLDTENYELGQQ